MSAHVEMREQPTYDDSSVAGLRSIEVHLREFNQLFDSLDHSPFRERDLDPKAEEYIVESIRELSSKMPCALVVYLEQPAHLPEEGKVIADAIHTHFARRAQLLGRELRTLLRRGVISLFIGLTVLVTFFIIGQSIQKAAGESHWAALIRESLLIGGWVAMWKPLEIFLYDWWPIVGNRNVNERLSQIKVDVVHIGPRLAAAAPADKSERSPISTRN